MGNTIPSWASGLLKDKVDKHFLVLGPQNSGKKTLIYNLGITWDNSITVPCIQSITTNSYKNIHFLSGDTDERILPLFKYYFDTSVALIIVIDSSSDENLGTVKDFIRNTLQFREDGIPVLVFANKQDIKQVPEIDIVNALELYSLPIQYPCLVQPCCAFNKDSLETGLQWIISGADNVHGNKMKSKTTKSARK